MPNGVSSTLSTFKKQLDVINATEPADYKSTAKEKALEEENRKLKELLGKKSLKLDRACKLLQVSRTSCYPKKKAENANKAKQNTK